MILTDKLKEKINNYFESLNEDEFRELLTKYGIINVEDEVLEEEFINTTRKLEFTDIRVGMEFYRSDMVENRWLIDRLHNFEKLTTFVNYLNNADVPMGKFRVKLIKMDGKN